MKKIIILSFITIATLIFIFIFTNKKEKNNNYYKQYAK